MDINPSIEPQAQLISNVVANYLTEQGYYVAQELTGDDCRVALVGRKDNKRVVAEIQLGAGHTMQADSARVIVKKVKAIMNKHDTSDGIVVLPIATRLDEEARQTFEEAALQLLKIDPENNTVSALDRPDPAP